jgi:outer membrane biosynthesis protein TonB
MNLQGEEFLPTGPAPRSDTQPKESAAGLALSVVLHCFALLLLFVVGISGTEGSEGGLQIVPIEVEIVQQNAAAAAEQRVADVPRSDVAQLPPDPAHIAATPLPQPARTDELQAKLEALAKLRQPDAVTPNQDNGAARPDKVATNDDIGSGEEGPFSIKDYIRAQIERRWNLDLGMLGDGDFSVPIHVEMTSEGVVLKAEIVESARTNDPAYREVAVSARNAVLLSSPLSLPAGQYHGLMDMVLYLNPRDALR